MKKYCTSFIFIFFIFFIDDAFAQPAFKIIPLGVYGGTVESNLSAYMIAVNNTNNYICLDAGTLHNGIEKAILYKSINGNADDVLKNNIKGYLISHPHLDHVLGMIINSPLDTTKNIYALPFCLDAIKEGYFNGKSWANFGDEGEKPQLKKYHYMALQEGSETGLQNTNMFVRSFQLSHFNPNKSTAFLVRYDSLYILYLGDTGADSVENSNNLNKLWMYVAPLIQQHKLKGIFIEVSFPDTQPANKLFGHLTPSLFFAEMNKLSAYAGAGNLQKLTIIITHIKPDGNNEALIKKELGNQNKRHLNLLFPIQGKAIKL